MRFLAAVSVLVSLAVAFPALAEDKSGFRAPPILKDALVNHIRPSYAAFEQSASELHASTTMLCETALAEDLETVRQGFGKTVNAWSRIEWLRVGPVMSDNRLERILFYPDRKSTGLKQVQRAIASKDEGVTDAETLAGGSVAMQGLGAFEYLVFGTGKERLLEEPQTHRCRYARTVAANLRNLSGEIVEAWSEGTPLADAFIAPAQNNLLFRDGTEALNLILGTMIHGLEAIRDIRIGSFLQTDGKDRPMVAIHRRSGLTMQSVVTNLEGLEALFNDSNFQNALSAETANLADQVRFEFQQSIRTAKNLAEVSNGDIEALLADDMERQKLVYLQLSIRYVIQRLNDEIAPAAGLAAGFSFGDGD